MIDDNNTSVADAVIKIEYLSSQYLDLFYNDDLTYQQMLDFFELAAYVCSTFDDLVICIFGDAEDIDETLNILYDALQEMDILYSFIESTLAYYGYYGALGVGLHICINVLKQLIS